MFRFARQSRPSRNNHRLSHHCRLAVEAMEERAVPAVLIDPKIIPPETVTASLQFGTLAITGTSHDDLIAVGQKNGRIYVSGVSNSFYAPSVAKIVVDGKAGNDVIHLDGVGIAGASAIAKPTVIHGGDGNDALFGGVGNDVMYGDAGNDFMLGNAGYDALTGGAGKDQMFGGIGNDQIFADFADGTLAGQAGTDRVVFTDLDPAPLANYDPALLQQVAQAGVANLSFSKSKDGGTLTVNHMSVTGVSIVNGVTTLTIKAHLKATWGPSWARVSESGDITLTVQPKVSAVFSEAQLQSASVRLTNVNVTSVHLNNVPGWMTNNSYVRDFLTAQFQNLPNIPATAQLQMFLALGYSLGPTIQV
jgi:RTX calcium-binding nonapeptide repeat (4 copies)